MTRLGPYEIVRTLGTGGFAETCEARHLLLGTRACLKVSLEGGDDELLLREGRILASLQHPSLPVLRDVFRHPGGGLVLAMSYAPGETLDRLGTLTPEAASRIAAKVLRALAYLHKGGIVHGDVKPANVVVESTAVGASVVLVDLGLAAVRPGNKTKPLGWTERFAAPEVVSGAPPLPESDLYSLGKTLAASLGADPVTGLLPAGIPLGLAELILALTDPRPARRPLWETKDPLRWLERVRRVLTRRKGAVSHV